jgi:hypothetical protein
MCDLLTLSFGCVCMLYVPRDRRIALGILITSRPSPIKTHPPTASSFFDCMHACMRLALHFLPQATNERMVLSLHTSNKSKYKKCTLIDFCTVHYRSCCYLYNDDHHDKDSPLGSASWRRQMYFRQKPSFGGHGNKVVSLDE